MVLSRNDRTRAVMAAHRLFMNESELSSGSIDWSVCLASERLSTGSICRFHFALMNSLWFASRLNERAGFFLLGAIGTLRIDGRRVGVLIDVGLRATLRIAGRRVRATLRVACRRVCLLIANCRVRDRVITCF